MGMTATYTDISGFAFCFQRRQEFGEGSGCAQHNGGEENLHKSAILLHDSLNCDRRAPTWSARQMTRMRALLSILLGRYAKDEMRVRVVGFVKRRWCCEKEERWREKQIIKGTRNKPTRYFCYTMRLRHQAMLPWILGAVASLKRCWTPSEVESLFVRRPQQLLVPQVEGSRAMRSSASPVAIFHVPC